MYSISQMAYTISQLNNPVLNTPLDELDSSYSYYLYIDEYEDYTLVTITL